MGEKAAIVTGGGRGIGRAIVIEFARRGMNILINYAGNEESALETKALCEEFGIKAAIFQADVSDFSQSKKIFDKCLEEFERVDILVNNAGITKDNLVLRMSEKDFEDVLNINLKGAFNCSKHAFAIMAKQRNGVIINITSISAITGNSGQANYCAAKAGLIGLTKSNAKEFAKRNIRVNAVAPGFIETDMTRNLPCDLQDSIKSATPLNRFGKAEEVAKAVAFLASDEGSFITGQVLCVDGGAAM